MMYIVCGVIYINMNNYKHSTNKCLCELPFILCGPSGDIEVYEDTNLELIEHYIFHQYSTVLIQSPFFFILLMIKSFRIILIINMLHKYQVIRYPVHSCNGI